MLEKISRNILLKREKGNPVDIWKKRKEIKKGKIIQWAHGYPDKYSIGMCSIGYQLIYFLLNLRNDVFCERFFTDYPYTIETNSPLRKFDVVSFTLSYELTYPEIINLLIKSGIPPFASQRKKPLLLAGGFSVSYNPAPLSTFFDAFVIGEGEKVVNEIVEAYKENKNKSKEEILKSLSKIEGIYVPTLHHEYQEVKRVRMNNINFFQPFIISPFTTTPNCGYIEIMRGCGRGCRFCVLGYTLRPPKFRSVKTLKEIINYLSRYTKKVRLVAPSEAEHPQIKKILSYLKSEKFEVIVGSQRAELVDRTFLDNIDNKEFTLAPETSLNLRYKINKLITDEEVLSAVKLVNDFKFDRLNLFLIIGFPFETKEDIKELAKLIKKIYNELNKKIKLKLHINCHIKKPFTPFQWDRQLSYQEYINKFLFLKEEMKKMKINAEIHIMSKKQLMIESILARGDEKTGKILYKATMLGNTLDSWSTALKLSKRTLEWYIREKNFDEHLPWDIIDSGVSKEYLIEEYEKAKNSLITLPCRFGCKKCGVCK